MLCARSSLLLFLLCVSVQAQSVVILQNGRAWYTPDGSTVAIPVDRVIRLGGGPTPPGGPTPIPPNDSELTQLSATWPSKVSPYDQRGHHRQGLATTYGVLGRQAADGQFSDLAQLQDRTEAVRDLVLGESKSRWDQWGKDIAGYLGQHVATVAQASTAYLDVAAGLEVPNSAIGSGWVTVIEFIIGVLGEGALPPRMLALIKLLLGALGGGI